VIGPSVHVLVSHTVNGEVQTYHVYTCTLSGAGVVSSSGSSGKVEKSTFSRNELGAFRKSSGRIQGRFGEIEDEMRAKSRDSRNLTTF
jgi:hypothetical protein